MVYSRRSFLSDIGILGGAAIVPFGSLLSGCGCSPKGTDEQDLRPASTQPARPNVVLVSLDTVAMKHLRIGGYHRNTMPTLDRLAREAVSFTNCYVHQPWTLTSHMSLLTSLYPKAHRVMRHSALAEGIPTLPQIFKAAGYDTAGIVGAGGWIGAKYGFDRGFDSYREGSGGFDIVGETRLRTEWLEKQAEKIRLKPDHRFFLFAHYFEAHSDDSKSDQPYDSPHPYRLMYCDTDDSPLFRGNTGCYYWKRMSDPNLSERDIRYVTGLYDGGLRYLDDHGLAPLIRKLDELGLSNDTLLVISADHGETFGAHGVCLHQAPYRDTLLTPALFRLPGLIPAGETINRLTRNIDIAPTILDIAGLPPLELAQGRSLLPDMKGRPGPEPFILADGIRYEGNDPQKPWIARSSYIERSGGALWSYYEMVKPKGGEQQEPDMQGQSELYCLDEDPWEENNVVAQHPERAKKMQARLAEVFRANERTYWHDVKPFASAGKAVELDEAEQQDLRGIGYLK